MLLQKTLLHIEGLARQLHPDLDLWATGRPILEQWIRDQGSVRAIGERMRGRLPRWMHLAPELPELVHDYLKRQAALPPPGPTGPPAGESGRIVLAIAGAGLVVAGALLLGRPPEAFGPYPGLAAAGAGVLCLLGAARRR